MACPRCGQCERFRIEALTTFTTTADGTEDNEGCEYGADAWAACAGEDCDWEGTVAQLLAA
jgi:hypothetical protein